MITIKDFLKYGYFPKELPPPFNSKSYAEKTSSDGIPDCLVNPQKKGKVSVYNLARPGSLRRILGIPNPIHHYSLVKVIVDNWGALESHFNSGTFSNTKPTISTTKNSRYLVGNVKLDERVVHRARILSTSRYYLRTDITRCYPSIYTHSIPWALHTKKVAKKNTKNSLFGNLIDKKLRHGQDNQTIGIPIGPDSSLVIAETVLTAVDLSLSKEIVSMGFRFIDDYEFGFKTLQEAEETLGALQEVLSTYELELNPKKTSIIDLPYPVEAIWASELRIFNIEAKGVVTQKYDLIAFFGKAFELSKKYPEESVLRYALGKLNNSNIIFHPSNWGLLQNLLLQVLMAEAGTLQPVMVMLEKHRGHGYSLDIDKFSLVLFNIFDAHSKIGHHSEIAWALWAIIIFNITLPEEQARNIEKINNSVVALLALDAMERGLINKSTFDLSLWQSYMNEDELYGENWLLCYEAAYKGWLTGTEDYISKDACFSYLKNNDVSFYDGMLISSREETNLPAVFLRLAKLMESASSPY